MTHEYTILFGGVVIPGGDAPAVTAIAWAADTILAVGTDDAVRAISRGDSRFVDLAGARVVPADDALEVGGPANLLVLDAADPRLQADGGEAARIGALAIIRRGEVVEGALPAGTPACTAHAP